MQFLKSTSSNLSDCPGIFEFEGPDDKKNYAKNKWKRPDLNKKISYSLNSYGYRCPEFTDINWNNSIVALGCSHTYGVAVDDTETYSYQLQKKLNKPVINLGMAGWSIWHIVYTARILKSLHPHKVIIQVPNMNRFAIFESNNDAVCLGGWRDEDRHRKFFELYNFDDTNPKTYQEFALEYLQYLLPCICFVFSFREENLGKYIQPIDIGRDREHPGPDSHSLVAETIFDHIKINK